VTSKTYPDLVAAVSSLTLRETACYTFVIFRRKPWRVLRRPRTSGSTYKNLRVVAADAV